MSCNLCHGYTAITFLEMTISATQVGRLGESN